MREAKKSFVHSLWFLFVDVMQSDFSEPIDAKEQIQLSERPRHDVHMGTALDSPHETGEAREEPSEKELKPRRGKPYIRCSDDQFPARRQMFACRFEKEVGITKVLNPLATHNGLVKPQVIGKAHVEIDVTKPRISFGGEGE